MLNNKFAVKGDFIREMEKVRIGKWAAFILGCRAGCNFGQLVFFRNQGVFAL
jgi:hypothetical protein